MYLPHSLAVDNVITSGQAACVRQLCLATRMRTQCTCCDSCCCLLICRRSMSMLGDQQGSSSRCVITLQVVK